MIVTNINHSDNDSKNKIINDNGNISQDNNRSNIINDGDSDNDATTSCSIVYVV